MIRRCRANCEVRHHLIYQVLENEVRTMLKPLNLAYYIATKSCLGKSERNTVDEKIAVAFRIDFFFAFPFVGVAIIRIYEWST